MDDQKITYFAETNFHNKRLRFGIKRIDRRKHMYVVGKTGTGKTTLLENMAMQDIQNGEGLAFIDPHGDTAYKLLDFVPKSRVNDVIYFDPGDIQFPIALNVMENVDPERRHFIASGLMAVFKKTFGPDVWSARMEYILGNTVLALLEYPGSTLLSINPMLAVKEFRKKVVENVSDPVVKAFWVQEFAKYTERFAAEATPAIQNKIGQFTSNALIRNIVGQPISSFDFRKAMDEKKIIIINLAKGRVGEDTSRLLGTMIVTKIYLAAMSRVDVVDENNRPDFFFYVDEFQNFATESFANILSEARKYRLSLILAHQFMAQLDEEVRDAVIGNMGTMMTFRVGADDAEFLEKEYSPEFTANDIVNLGFAQIYLKLMIDGFASRPFSAATLPPIVNNQVSMRDAVVEASRKNYAHDRATVDGVIQKWSEDMAVDEANAPSKEGGERGGFKASSGPMFDATCYACGKKTQVPFQPDPRRPVFCKEHIGIAGKFPKTIPDTQSTQPVAEKRESVEHKSDVAPIEKPAPVQVAPIAQEQKSPAPVEPSQREWRPPRPMRPSEGSVVPKRDEKPITKTISLKDLARHSAPVARTKPSLSERPQSPKQDHLATLREALKKSLEAKSRRSTDQSSSEVGPPAGEAGTPTEASGKTPLSVRSEALSHVAPAVPKEPQQPTINPKPPSDSGRTQMQPGQRIEI
jgi:CxxC-x17-CxxC domain-containing protein